MKSEARKSIEAAMDKGGYFTADNEESGIMLRAESQKAEISKLNETFSKFDKACKGIESLSIDSVNLGRELGLHLQALCGHKQMKFTFWQSHCHGQVKFDFKSASLFMSIANKIESPVTTLDEAVPLMQTVLQADGILVLSERTENQKPSSVSVLQRFFAEVTLIRSDFKKAVRQTPMEQWEADSLDSFLSETEWIQEEREKAQHLKANGRNNHIPA